MCSKSKAAKKLISEKGVYHRSYAEVSLSALEYNLAQLKKYAAGKKVMAIIKADAYGHGANEVASLLEDDVDYFGVATFEEAITVREYGIKKPILILAYSSPSQYERLVEAELTQTVYDTDNARLLSDAAVRAGKKAKVHVALDTGMSRIGFSASDESIERIKELALMPGLCLEGIFSHYATADETDLTFAEKQLECFSDFCTRLECAGVKIPLRHMCNSAGTLCMPEKFDMVRLGILLYGLYPEEHMKKYGVALKPAMRIMSHVVDVRTVPAGTGVSYGQKYTTARETKIATVSIGYADGYSRALSDCGRVIVGGAYAPVIGRVCMDLMMVDVTGIPDVRTGDSVVIIGESGGLEITSREIAELTGTINYEVICSFKNRVTRVYTE